MNHSGATAAPPAPVDDPVTHCTRTLINARWDPSEVKCGNDATMLADSTNIPSSPDGDFTVKLISDGSSIGAATAPPGPTFSAVWQSQKPSDTWDGNPECSFTVAAGGLTADSHDPQLSFYKYPDVARRRYTARITSTVNVGATVVNYGWDRVSRVEFKDRVMIIHIPIKIRKAGAVPAQNAGESYQDWAARWVPPAYDPAVHNLTARERWGLKSKIERHFKEKMALHRKDCKRGNDCPDPCPRKCCRFEIKVEVHLYNRDSRNAPAGAAEVNYWTGNERANSAHWFDGDYPAHTAVFAHEVGHLMGFYDEYGPDGATSTTAPWQGNNPGALMCDLGRRLERYYFSAYALWLKARFGESFKVTRYVA